MFSRLLKFLTCMSLCTIITFYLSACYDLGEDVKTEEDYYSLFPTVTMVSDDGIDTINMKDIYNKETSDNLTSPLSADKGYRFMIVAVNPPSGSVLSCDSVAMCILYSGDTAVTLEASCYVGTQDLFDKITSEERSFTEDSQALLGRATVNLKPKIDTPNAKQPQNSFVLSFSRSDFSSNGYIIVLFKSRTSGDVVFRPTNVMIHTNSLKNGE